MIEMDKQEQIPLLAVVGPTASGKTGLAVSLALALHGEVISADSMQIYKRMDIATAKPETAEMRGIPHHLLDFVEPDNAAFSVADYAVLAREKIREIAARGKLPILAGGTGLYVGAVVDHIDFTPIASDGTLRATLQAQAREEGNARMLEHLREVDPGLAETLHPNNLGRILRALEVFTLTGIPMSEHQRRSRLTPPPYKLCMLGLDFQSRELLYERINRRVDLMLERGLLAEAAQIAQSYGGTACQAIGYKELQPYLDGVLPLEICVENLKQASRRYAKRQLTWFRRDSRIQWLMADTLGSEESVLQTAQNDIHKSGIV